VELASGGTVIRTTTTDAAGRFRFQVPRGTYEVTAHNVGHPSQATEEVTVNAAVDVTLTVDSGMR
jgi:hypothetical protein